MARTTDSDQKKQKGSAPRAADDQSGSTRHRRRKKELTPEQKEREQRLAVGVRRRIAVLMIFWGVLAFIPLIVTLYRLQITQHDHYETLSVSQQTRTSSLSSTRGSIYDRNGAVLATNETVYTVFISPAEIDDLFEEEESANRSYYINVLATGLGSLLEADASDIRAMAENIDSYYQVIRREVPEETADEVLAFLADESVTGCIPEGRKTGVYLEEDYKRVYPNESLASTILGFTGFNGSELSGLEGLEYLYNDTLSGSSGKIVVTKGNAGTALPESQETVYEATDGCDLITTIDATVQAALEENLENAMEEFMVQNGAFGIFMDVTTGEILGMASMGDYDPNDYSAIFDEETAAELTQQLRALSELPEEEYDDAYAAYSEAVSNALFDQWRNRTVSDTYEPGSTFKLITLAAALEDGAVTLEDTWYCGGSTEEIRGRTDPLNCWENAGHGVQTTADALANSCNIAFANIGIRLGGGRFYEYAEAFGILNTTGISLPGEADSVFFSRSTLDTTASYAELASASFGQTFRVTPIQLCSAICAVVNGGTLLEPHIISQIREADGTVSYQAEPTAVRQVISAETSETMCELMINVVENGTATGAQIAGYHIGGKTGTSEKIDKYDENGELVSERIVSFAGVAFDENGDAKYLCLCALDTPSAESGYYISGGVMGTATVRGVFADTLEYLGFEIDTSMENADVIMPDLTGLTAEEVETVLADHHLNFAISGTAATVTDQIPAAGTVIPSGSEVKVYMGADKPVTPVTVPNVVGCTAWYAKDMLQEYGLYVKIVGSSSNNLNVLTTKQNIEPGTQVQPGTVIEVSCTDTSSRD